MRKQVRQREISLLAVVLIGWLLIAAAVLVACLPTSHVTKDLPDQSSPYLPQPTTQLTTTPLRLFELAQSAPSSRSMPLNEESATVSLSKSVHPLTETLQLALEISTSKAIFQPGEPISVALVMRNIAVEPLTVIQDLDPWTLTAGQVIRCRLKHDGQNVRGPDVRYYRLRTQDLAILAPGQEIRYVLKDLDFCAEKSQMGPGDYTLSLAYKTDYVGEHLRNEGIWIGEVRSNEVTFIITSTAN